MQAVSDLPKKHLWPKPLTSVATTPADTQALAQLSPEERTTWRSAVTYYTDTLASRDLVDDEGLHAILTQLSTAASSTDLAGADIPAPLRTILRMSRRSYRHYFSSRHDAANWRWQVPMRSISSAQAARSADMRRSSCGVALSVTSAKAIGRTSSMMSAGS